LAGGDKASVAHRHFGDCGPILGFVPVSNSIEEIVAENARRCRNSRRQEGGGKTSLTIK
jgi:hypothetical protein